MVSIYNLVGTHFPVCSRLNSERVPIFHLLKSGLPVDRFQALCNFNRFTRDRANASANLNYYAVCNFLFSHFSPHSAPAKLISGLVFTMKTLKCELCPLQNSSGQLLASTMEALRYYRF